MQHFADALMPYLISGLMTLISTLYYRFTKKRMEESTRDAVHKALQTSLGAGIEAVLKTRTATAMNEAIQDMVTYVDHSVPDSLKSFGLDVAGKARGHLFTMAKNKLTKELATILPPDELTTLLKGLGAPAVEPR